MDTNEIQLSGISYPAAMGLDGTLHWATDAPPTLAYVCIGCNSPMVIKGGMKRRRHFSHKPGSHCTAPETALHRLAKQTIKDAFLKAVDAGIPYAFRFHCYYCGIEHERNMVKRATVVRVETRTDGIVPDLTLYDHNEKLLGAIEIVVTHLPARATEDVYVKLGIPVMLVFPKWSNVEKLRQRVWADVLVNNAALCPAWLRHFRDLKLHEQQSVEIAPPQFNTANKCPKCNRTMEVRLGYLYQGYPCKGCKHINRIVRFSTSWNEFHQQEKLTLILRKLGIRAERTFSKTTKTRYLMNRCMKCSWMFGDFYLGSEVASINECEHRAFGYCGPCRTWYLGSCQAVGRHNPSIESQLRGRDLGKFSIPSHAESEYIDELREEEVLRELER